MKYGTSEEVKNVANNRRRRNLNDKQKSGREKPIGPVKVTKVRSPIIEVDDDTVIDLRSIKKLSDVENMD